MNIAAGLLGIAIAALVLIPLAVVLVLYVLVPICRGIGWCVGHVFRFVAGEIGDAFRTVGAVITAIVFAPLILGSIVIGRWSASAHFGRALQGELKTMCACVYRMLIGHPAHLLCLTPLTEGIEKRLPEIVAATPGRDRPHGRAGQFDGYSIIGSLPGGGSGGKLYVAEPNPVKLASFARQGQDEVGQVVIKSFSLSEGSSLPQIVRESRSLDAAKRMGLVLDHELTEHRFYYVMRYVPGESLALVTQRLHAESGPKGLSDRALASTLGYIDDLVKTLDTYHRGGLWHKDVKPDNIIVDGTRAQLVDFGLLSSLRSSLTLTTHGTEYFRDPEMVRMALRGVKVHQVNGAKFDIYGAGAVLYSAVENSFPAHGGLSHITKRCPEALRWIIRRAMTDYDKRYESASAMLADLRAVTGADDPFAVKPIDLPSMKDGASFVPQEPQEEAPASEPSVQHVAYASTPLPEPVPAEPAPRIRPKLRVANWWTGRYQVEGEEAIAVARRGSPRAHAQTAAAAVAASLATVSDGFRGAAARREARRRVAQRVAPVNAGHPLGLTAREQIERARARAAETRKRAHDRAHRRSRGSRKDFSTNPNPGVAVVVMGFIGLAVLAGGAMIAATFLRSQSSSVMIQIPPMPDSPRGGAAAASVVVGPGGVRVSTPGDVPVQAPVQVSTLLTGRRAVVLRETSAFEPSVVREIDTRLGNLFNRGVDLVGYTPAGVEIDPGEGDTDLVADLRVQVGVSPWRSPSAQDAISMWLGGHDDIDAVIWIARDPRNEKRASIWTVPSPRLDDTAFDTIVEVLGSGRD